MGEFLHFRVGAKTVGTVCFSSFTMTRQHVAYGIDWADCITYDEDGGEVVGTPGEDTSGGWYQPNWERAVERIDRLLQAVDRTENPHRREYDKPKVEEMRRFIHHCAEPSRRAYAYVRIG